MRALDFILSIQTGQGIPKLFCIHQQPFILLTHLHIIHQIERESIQSLCEDLHRHAEHQTGCSLKQFTLDCRGEVPNKLLGPMLSKLGIGLHVAKLPALMQTVQLGKHSFMSMCRLTIGHQYIATDGQSFV